MDTTIRHLTAETFAEATREPGLTVVDFWASWCGPCRAMAPQFEKAAELRPQYRFAKVDVDAEPMLASRFGIRSIPTLVVLKNGRYDNIAIDTVTATKKVVNVKEHYSVERLRPVYQSFEMKPLFIMTSESV